VRLDSFSAVTIIVAWLIFDTEDGGYIFLRNLRYIRNTERCENPPPLKHAPRLILVSCRGIFWASIGTPSRHATLPKLDQGGCQFWVLYISRRQFAHFQDRNHITLETVPWPKQLISVFHLGTRVRCQVAYDLWWKKVTMVRGFFLCFYRVGQTQLGSFWPLITNHSNNTRENGKVPFVVDRCVVGLIGY
jgi:hypothetical protein